jgi:hypothetical protein
MIKIIIAQILHFTLKIFLHFLSTQKTYQFLFKKKLNLPFRNLRKTPQTNALTNPFSYKVFQKISNHININLINSSQSIISIPWLIHRSNAPLILILANSFFRHQIITRGVNYSAGINEIAAGGGHGEHGGGQVLLLRRGDNSLHP